MISVLGTVLTVQLPADSPGKSVEVVSIACVPATLRETWKEFPFLGFSVIRPICCGHLGNDWRWKNLFPSMLICLSSKCISLFLKNETTMSQPMLSANFWLSHGALGNLKLQIWEYVSVSLPMQLVPSRLAIYPAGQIHRKLPSVFSQRPWEQRCWSWAHSSISVHKIQISN